MNKGCCNEVFWVQRPGILLTWGCNNNGCDTGQNQRRGGAATWNDATKILIVLSIVLLILKVSWWWILLLVGILIIIFAYYNTHPDGYYDGYPDIYCATNNKLSSEVEVNEIKEGYKNTQRGMSTKKQSNDKYPVVGRNTTSSTGIMPRPVPGTAYRYIDDDSGTGKDTKYLLAGNGRRTGASGVAQNEAFRPRMAPKVVAPRDKKFRGGVIGGIDAPRVSVTDRRQDDITYETDIPTIEVPREEIEGIDKMDKKYTMSMVTPSIIREDPLQMYRDSLLDEERAEANNEIEREHESGIAAVTSSFVYKY